jgi:predicted nucleic acid-binding protein
MILLDSNIIVYSLNNSSPKQAKSQKFIKDNLSGLCLSHQNILESIRVLTHTKFLNPMPVRKANDAVWTIAESLKVISPNQEALFLVRELIDKYHLSENKIFDAYLVATAMANEIFTIATDNVRDFKTFKEIGVIDPFN